MDEETTTEPAQARPMLHLGETAPDFEAVTTHGPMKLSDYKGGWVILFSHPADFTPVCTTEFMGFAKMNPELEKRGVKLIGLSVDSVHSHIAWVRNIEEKMGVKIPFPVIADLSMNVGTLYGMIHPGQSATAAVRCVFVIDPDQILRAMIYYPLSTGRNMDEILRLVDALQAADKYGIATPADWRPGDQAIVPPPATTEEAEKRLSEGYDCKDWYFCKKTI
ncbi:MAG: peroxiredoxin [ANME-2 cluster archaeon]|jgi:peroxiredoxin (alkyl hydroperoxide reductase subunit C)|nr:MAG: peroxiredoxin [ANME-2 cluster archaeon]